MYAYGKDVLPDPGSYSYDSSEMRKFILDTRSHNCATVDGNGQRRRKTYRWTSDMIKQRSDLKWAFTGAIDTVEGVYNEGYGDELTNVTHNRKVIFFKEGISGSEPFALVIDRLKSADGSPHTYEVSYQMDVQPYTVDEKRFTADHGDGVTMSVVGSKAPTVTVAQYEPIYMGWRPKHGEGGVDREHYPAPCLRYIERGESCRIVTALCPSEGGVTVCDVIAANDVDDKNVTVIFSNGNKVTVNESDYPCGFDSEEKLTV